MTTKKRQSWLDRLQKDAQASELDFTNTSPYTFLLLSLLQVALALAVSSVMSPRFLNAAVANIGFHWLGFLISLILDTNMYFDITEDVQYLLVMAWSFLTIVGPPSSRQRLVYACATIWCMRLCAFVGYRVVVRGSDWRFKKLHKARAYSFFGWTSGGFWCWANGFALWLVADMPSKMQEPLGWLDAIGLGVFVLGFSAEILADFQKYAFNQKFASGRNTRWIESGLWAYSRHPNYAGEILLWSGLAIVCIGGTGNICASTVLVAAVTPLWSLFFLLFTSLMLLEKKSDNKWQGQAAYESYKERTPVLFPSLW